MFATLDIERAPTMPTFRGSARAVSVCRLIWQGQHAPRVAAAAKAEAANATGADPISIESRQADFLEKQDADFGFDCASCQSAEQT